MERAGDLLEAFLRLHNITGGEEYVSFFKSWHRIVGTDLAAHTRVTDIDKGALKVEVDHPGWMQVLQMRKNGILRKVSAQYPQLEVRNMHMRLVSRFSAPGERAGDAERRAADRKSAGSAGSRAAAGGAGRQADSESADSTAGSGRPDAGEAPRGKESKSAKEALDRIEDDTLKDTLARLYEDLSDTDAD